MEAAVLRRRLEALTLRDEHRLARRLRHAHDDAALARVAAEIGRAEARVQRRRAAVPAVSYPPELPVSARRDDLLAAIRDHQVVVVAGETGSGKTTQLPKLCLELGRGVRGAIAHTQPRRIAARTVAQRIADELGVPLGEAVGYAVRFSDRSGEDTLVRLVTDGLLLAEIQHDRLLRRYDTVIVDEAHERSLNIDFLLGYLHSILPRRPDLKLIITSATIDPQRFAGHFGGVPVVEVSGRTYPVETRYRPLTSEDGGAEADLPDAIADAVDELAREGPGDTLVFLSGEREIRDAAEALLGRFRDRFEILPLYARLSAAEQQRVFRPHSRRRVVLATNVAETSLTVPGIRYVVDPGTARISRYSARLKVQRLPIEPISQASADQRKGRCGRTADGICIRLYGEEDFAARPRFTDPEIQRTSLASVILQMAHAGLGAVEDFPFIDPPDRRQVRDGVNLLVELGALDERGGLTQPGRRIARLPVDPRLARMVLEADRRGCAEEVITIAAALSIQDPRERPATERAQADQQHARFADPQSDFLALLNLWGYLREQQRELSGSQFRRRCKAEYLHYLRVREWQDLAAQLRSAAKEVGVHRNREPAGPAAIHQALLAGLLSQIGLRDARTREYQGARGARFALWPGSSLARGGRGGGDAARGRGDAARGRASSGATWVMVAELVETSRLWGRTAARIEPQWVEPLAEHLLKRSYSEPRWDARRAQVVATERVTLYGLPIVSGRTVGYARIDPAPARALFIRRALVEGEWEDRHEFLAENARRVAGVEALEERVRRRDLLAGDEVRFGFFDERIPPDVASGAHFDRWWRDARRERPELLTYPHELLIDPSAGDVLDPRARPTGWRQGDLVLRLSYRFEPGHPHDGVTAHVPVTALPQLRPDGFEWLVPALRPELVTALLRSLPKELRRPLVPVPETAARTLARLKPRSGPLTAALARELGVPEDAFDATRLPPHLRMTFQVEGDDGEVLAVGEDLDEVRAAVAPRLRAQLTQATASLERSGLRSWDGVGELPRTVELAGTTGFPALVDEGATVGVRTFEDRGAQAAAMRAGTRRLLGLTIPSPARAVAGALSNEAKLSLLGAPHGSVEAVLGDALEAALEHLLERHGGPAWDERGFAALRGRVAAGLPAELAAVVAQVVRVLDAYRDVQARLAQAAGDPLREARLDVAGQIGGLVYDGFVTATGVDRLPDVERYLRAAARRLERLPSQVAADRDRMRAVHELEAAWRRSPAAPPEVRWMLEELRVSHFAQDLGVRGQVSSKRIRRALAG